ncbi:S41 family peptidase [Flavobacterium sp. N3904]|uniref:S41 family peptidase n=1 Tax=Flavobacterium sp. N3904 TaxID=2986835 RepID=UPI0022250BF9|nr:S41 family peptidase [Flavobacterium sp. N3904]
MKKIFLLTFFILLFIQCTSVKEHNKHLNDLIAVNNLKTDVDFAYKKLQRLEPKLYWYISKKELDFKFDSLKNTITKPLTSFEFYKKLSPVVAAIREGHLSVSPSLKMYTKAERKELSKMGIGPFSQFNFIVINDKLYVLKNQSENKSILPGTEVVAINGKKTNQLIKEYSTLFSSDGYNQTFKNNRLPNSFSSFYTNENGIQDSLKYSFRQNDSTQIVYIKRKIAEPKTNNKKEGKEIVKPETNQIKISKKDKSTYGYNKFTKTNNRNLKFIENDSSIAVLKINHFDLGNYSRFYKESFGKIQLYNTKTLIIDLRNNSGGGLKEIVTLYSYLADPTFVFIDPFQVVSRTSLIEKTPFSKAPLLAKILISPFYIPFIYSKVHKDKDKYYISGSESKPHTVNKNAFKGKVYVLINGGTFSAASIISSNLKGSKRAIFVGEETGGAYNGTVAGFMPTVELPNSGIKITVGLLVVAPHYKTELEGRGVFPDKEIIPTLEDRINGRDPEMNWILDDIMKKTTTLTENEKDKKITEK